MYYFSYHVSHGYFQHNLLSELCFTEEEAIKKLCDMHNGEEVEFFIGDNHKIHPNQFEKIDDLIKEILAIYVDYEEISAEIKLARYIITPSIDYYNTEQ